MKGDTTEEFLRGAECGGAYYRLISPRCSPAWSQTCVRHSGAIADRPSRKNVIPFDRLQRQALNRIPAPEPDTRPAAPPPAARKSPACRPSPVANAALATCADRHAAGVGPPAQDTQETLDFIPGVPVKGRKLKTDVDAQVFCDQPVATPPRTGASPPRLTRP